MSWLPHLSRPLWLLALPLLALLLWLLWRRRPRQSSWQRLLPPPLQPWLLREGASARQRLSPWWLLGIGWLLAVLVLAGPGWQRLAQPLSGRSEALVVMIELTPDLLATDLAPSRLEQVRRKLRDLLDARADAPTALIVYAGSAHVLMPLAEDPLTAHNLLSALHPRLMPLPGRRADLAVERALALLEQSANGHGQLLLLTGQLSAEEREGLRRQRAAHPQRLSILGVGTLQGAPISDPQGGLLRDQDGAIRLPRLQEAALIASADAYQRLSLDERDLQALGLLTPSPLGQSSTGHPPQTRQVWADQGHWLLLALLLLAACGARRGWLLVLPLLVLPPGAEAADLEALWRRADQRGLRLLEAGQPEHAARQFRDPHWQGIAHFRAGDYEAAADAFASAAGAVAHYNRGTALTFAGDYEAARQAYRQALRDDPQFEDARHNLQHLERWLSEQPTPAPPPPAQTTPSTAAEQPAASLPERPPAHTPAAAQPLPHPPPTPAPRATDIAPATPAQGANEAPQSAPLHKTTEPPALPRPLERPLDEQQQALEHWLRQIPDDPAELLQRTFWQDLQQQQERTQ
ncbi:tetratricopeptide repeat protein [Pseudomonas sp. NW5]|uniref:tetratricopeptide repeat protein n=1 Tax=Pseudomonas sp. NW5 TaxID=2934934 RepID=UPI002020D453|nr:tetratricopeptide repeat protein [Pseudomonas sp. NW5]MCL7461719.1 tetratricopeptide repeat protein [Pseudomonas sp. NW5]